MPGTDQAGYSGLKDQINNHMLKPYGRALLISLIGAGQAVGQIQAYGQAGPGYGGYGNPNTSGISTATGVAGSAVAQQFGQLGREQVRRGMMLPPKIEIRPGYEFNVMVTGRSDSARTLPQVTAGAWDETQSQSRATTDGTEADTARRVGFQLDSYSGYVSESTGRKMERKGAGSGDDQSVPGERQAVQALAWESFWI